MEYAKSNGTHNERIKGYNYGIYDKSDGSFVPCRTLTDARHRIAAGQAAISNSHAEWLRSEAAAAKARKAKHS